jgi:hypothetical protein
MKALPLSKVCQLIDPARRNAKTIHHCGFGRFVVDDESITLKSRMR